MRLWSSGGHVRGGSKSPQTQPNMLYSGPAPEPISISLTYLDRGTTQTKDQPIGAGLVCKDVENVHRSIPYELKW